MHGNIFKLGIPHSYLQSVLVEMYAKCGETDSFRDVFNEICVKRWFSLTMLITGYVQNGYAVEG